ncbi:MAG: fatty acid desaturase [Polyangiaceae bacterium]|jgi:stearoyl-CoA desaturase (delta-9 desaturase)
MDVSLPAPEGRRGLMDSLSDVLFVAMHLAFFLVFLVPISWKVVLMAAVGYLVRMAAITAGFHRYFAHRAYRTSRFTQAFVALLGTTAMQNGPIWWASVHRRHHKYSDEPFDPHSPVQRGFWYAHVGWIFDRSRARPDLSNATDLSRFPELRFIDRHHWIPIIAWAFGCYAIGGLAGVVWGFIVSTLAVFHATLLINSLAHVWGSRRYVTADASRNNALLAILTLGEGWHNNHHHYMSSARQGFFWWEVDVSYYLIRALARLGVVWEVREPPASAVAGPRERMRRPAQAATDASTPAAGTSGSRTVGPAQVAPTALS